MPLLFALGQHAALTAIQGSLGAEERLMAFLDDLYVATPIPDRLRNVYGTMQQELWTHSRIRINGGKTQVWNSCGVRPEFCDTLERIAQATDPESRVWRGSGLPLGHESSLPICRTVFGVTRRCSTFIPEVPDLQSASPPPLRISPFQLSASCCQTGVSWSLRRRP